jgi:MFS family permease
LKFLRGKSDEGVQQELALIEVNTILKITRKLVDEINFQEAIEEAQKNKGSLADIFNNKGNLKALIICCGLLAFQQLSGINVVLFYSQSIFIKTGSSLEPAIATILVGNYFKISCLSQNNLIFMSFFSGVVQVLASGCTPFIADRLGRKLILLISAAGMCLFLVISCTSCPLYPYIFMFLLLFQGTLGLFFYLDSIKSSALPDLMWLPVVSLIGFVILYCIGLY